MLGPSTFILATPFVVASVLRVLRRTSFTGAVARTAGVIALFEGLLYLVYAASWAKVAGEWLLETLG
ncbi:MAG: hypothetical protein AAF533_23285 [Acidobacteriota bacterium]